MNTPTSSRISTEPYSAPHLGHDPGAANAGINFYIHPPQNRTEYFQQRTEYRRRGHAKTHKLPTYKGLATYLTTFIDPREIGLKLPSEDKPSHILTTATLNERISTKNRSGYLTQLDLWHHYRRYLRLYYVNRHDCPYIYPYLDFDSKDHQGAGDTEKAVAFIQTEIDIDGYSQPSSNGWGLYPKIEVSQTQPEEIRRILLAVADKLTEILHDHGFECRVEAKALPSIREFPSGEIKDGGRGVLGRLPLFECEEDYRAFRKQEAIPIENLRAAFDVQDAPTRETRKARGLSKPFSENKTPRKYQRKPRRPLPTPGDEPNARTRMLTNGYVFCQQQHRPPTPDELLNFYEAGPSARSEERTEAREQRAASISVFLSTTWITSSRHQNNITTPLDLPSSFPDIHACHPELLAIPEVDLVVDVGKAAVRHRRVTMDRSELNLIYSVVVHNFFNNPTHECPRNAIQSVWEIARREGIISRIWRNQYYQAGLKILTESQYLEIMIEYTKPRERPDGSKIPGKARLISPGPNSQRWEEASAVLSSLPNEPTPLTFLGAPYELPFPLGKWLADDDDHHLENCLQAFEQYLRRIKDHQTQGR